MTDLRARLEGSIADRYSIERELGHGGMATVFLARDTGSGAHVALKVFRNDVAMALGADRFQREIEVAGRLSHPHIIPLLESGQAHQSDGHPPLLYYSMPYVAGESLAARLEREGELPLPVVVTVIEAVASALSHAHARGIVHRDVKPANILLADTGPLVADFGIAHAVGQTGEQKLTSTGCVVGTPAYMSPEQAAGAHRVDGRADVYALGCVAYEMLVGEPPFSGPSTQAVLARHAVGQVPSLRVVRPELPAAVEAAVHRSLAKSPADRFQTPTEFAEALRAAALGGGTMVVPIRRPRVVRWLAPAFGVAMLLALVLLRPWQWAGGAAPPQRDATLLAVPPFTVGAGSDSVALRLAPGLARQVEERLPGGGGPRAAAVPDGDGSGAERVLLGEVWSSGGVVALGATLRDAASGATLARVDRITAPAESLPVLLDRLLVSALVRGAGLPPEHTAVLERLPLPATRSYLGARADFLAGRFDGAAARLEEVLRADSTAWPAALLLATVGEVHEDVVKQRALRLARLSGAGMTTADSFLLQALAWGEPGRSGSSAERLSGFEDATDAAPERAERWYLLGERLFHDGPLLGLQDALERAAQSFRHAVDREPRFVPALGHLIDIHAGRGDTAEVRVLARRHAAASPAGELADYYRWRVAVALGDSAGRAAVVARFDSLGPAALERIINVTQLDGLDLADAVRAGEALWAQSGVRTETRWAYMKQRELALNRGDSTMARTLLARQRASVSFRARDGLAEVVNALVWEADTTVPAAWVREVAPRSAADASAPAVDADVNYERCGVGLWHAAHDAWGMALRMAARLRRVPVAERPGRFEPLCAVLLEADAAAGLGAGDAASRLAALDSAAAAAPSTITWMLVAANLGAARLWEARGDTQRALAAVRRRPYIVDIAEPRVLVGLSTMLREEARLAQATGDRVGAEVARGRLQSLRSEK